MPLMMPEMVTLVSVGGKIIAVPGTQLRITDYFSASRVPWSENRSSIDVCVCVCLRGLFSGDRQTAAYSENKQETQTRTRTHTHTHRLPHQAPSQQSNVEEEEEENVRPKKIRRCYGKYNREDND